MTEGDDEPKGLFAISKRFFDEGQRNLAQCVTAIARCIEREDYGQARTLNITMGSEHGYTLAVLSGQHWKDAVFDVIKVEGAPRAFIMSKQTADAQPMVSNGTEGYRIYQFDAMFGDQGFAIEAPNNETIAIVKTPERAELIVQLLEQAAGNDMVGRWTTFFEDELESNGGDRAKAANVADAAFFKRTATGGRDGSKEESREEEG